MKDRTEQIPDSIFEWMEHYDFAALPPNGQQEVLKHMKAKDYDELFYSAYGIKMIQHAGKVKTEDSLKEKLMSEFDKKHHTHTSLPYILNQPVAIWKAAAIFLLFGVVWLQYHIIQQKKLAGNQLGAKADTVYIIKEVVSPPVKVFDTVYIEQGTKSPAKKHDSRSIRENPNNYYDSAMAYLNGNNSYIEPSDNTRQKRRLQAGELARKKSMIIS